MAKETSKPMYHITIKNNENDSIIIDIDSKCIIGSLLNNEDQTAVMGFSACGLSDLYRCILTCKETIETVKGTIPKSILKIFEEVEKQMKENDKQEDR